MVPLLCLRTLGMHWLRGLAYHYAFPGFTENTFDGSLSLHYAMTPLIGVEAGYHYTDVSSDAAFREYSRNRVFAGVSLTF